MSFRSGFFNSKNHDKQYYASDISKLFNSLINPGVFGNVGSKFIARAGEGMQVIIPSGMAWFNSTWTLNDSDVVINIDEAPYVANYSRIDGIFLQVFTVDDIGTRDNGAYYMKGTETSATPSKPVPTSTDGELYIPICYIMVANGITAITASMIENCVGVTETTPFITGILETAEISELLAQWEGQWNEWLAARKVQAEVDINEWTAADTTMWNNWFQSVKDDLGSIDIGNLKNKVDELTNLYVQEQVLYLPNTGASVTADETIVLGNDPGEPAIEGGNIQHVRVGNAMYDLVPSNSTSKATFASTSIELALKNLIDSFVSDGTYTGRFKATITPNKWFSYQIDLFDGIASGYIVNTTDPNESYNVRYRTQTDEQATIIKTLSSHIGMIIQSTTLDTEAKVIAIYGGTSWSKIEGRVLVGEGTLDSTHSYTVGDTGGEPEHTLTTDEIPSHSHSTTRFWSPDTGANYSPFTYPPYNPSSPFNTKLASGTNNTGGGQSHNNMQPYKVVYIWERTA